MHIKSNLRFHLTTVRRDKINKTTKSSYEQECGAREHFNIAGGNENLHGHYENQYCGSSENWESISRSSYTTLVHIF